MIARSGQMILNLLDSWNKGNEAVKQIIPQLVGLTTVTNEGVQSAGQVLDKSSKLSLILLGQFQIETCLRNVSDTLGLSSNGTGFYRTAENIILHLSCPSNMLAELNVPALIRNSLHNNGIHNGYQNSDSTTIVNGETYNFIHDKPVSCASWEHIAHSLERSVEILDCIFSTSAVSGIANPIIDNYAGHQ